MHHNFRQLNRRVCAAAWLVSLFSAAVGWAQTTSFTYQGKLTIAGNPANNTYDFQFELYDALAGGNQVGATFNDPNVPVANGVFTVRLDFGAGAFDGSARYLEIGVRLAGSQIAYTILDPRQQITATPYAIRASDAAAADGLSAACVNCVTGGQIQSIDGSQITGAVAGSQISGQIPAASVPTGSGNYIQNAASLEGLRRNAPQQAASFNIDGDGVIGGNLGVGTGASPPAAKLHVVGEIVLDVPVPTLHTGGAAIEQNRFLHLINSPAFRSAAGLKAGGVLVADGYGFANPGKNHLVVKGSIGIGTGVVDSSPKLLISGQNALEIGGFEPVLTMLDTSEPAAVSPTLYRFQAVKGFLGFNQRPVCNAIPCPSFRTPMVIDPAGNIGMSTNTPLGRLHAHHPGNVSAFVLSTGSGSEGQARFRIQADSGLFGQGRSLVFYDDIATQYRMVINGSGNVGLGTTTPSARLHVVGTAKTSVLEITGGSDLAEHFELAPDSHEDAKPGLVVAIDPQRPGQLVLARGAYNRRVAGVISGANNLSAGMVLPDLAPSEKSLPVALSGRVWVYCDAARNPIKPGDLLTTSTIPGHAMKVKNYPRAQGAIIGKAMTGLKAGKGLVLVLVSLQ